jgi:ferric-dicitrate binding protein FerR (iron transport regulator)
MTPHLLLQKYLDDRLTPEESAALQEALRRDPELRASLRDVAEQAVLLGDLGRVERIEDKRLAGTVPPSRPAVGRGSFLAAAAALVALLLAAAGFRAGTRERPVLTFLDGAGTVAWSRGAEWREDLAPGDRLGAGTLETVGETAAARLRFRDGSTLELAGDTELSFSEDGPKEIFLRRGSLSARVVPQPAARPMRVRTPSAEALVLGTAFRLSTRPDDTVLQVEEGLVRLKRLADGRSVEVPAKSTAVASLDSGSDLAPAVAPEPQQEWRFDFGTTVPPRIWRGVWTDGPDGGVMAASPYVARRTPDGGIVTHFGVSVRTAHLDSPVSLLAVGNSLLRFRLRLREEVPLQLMLLTNRVDGDFGGNFECGVRPEAARPTGDGWRELVVPVSRFRPAAAKPWQRDRYPTPVGNVITSVIVSTYGQEAGLEVASFGLETARGGE